jgi:hypothetical protein
MATGGLDDGEAGGSQEKGQLLEKRRCEKEEDTGAGRRDTYQPYFFSEGTIFFSHNESANNIFYFFPRSKPDKKNKNKKRNEAAN